MQKPHPDSSTLASRTPRGQDVRTLVLISPEASVKGMKVTDAAKILKAGGVSFYVIAGVKDKKKLNAAEKLLRSLRSGLKQEQRDQRVFFWEEQTNLNGEPLVQDRGKNILAKLKQFHDLKLKPIEQPWRNRESRLNR